MEQLSVILANLAKPIPKASCDTQPRWNKSKWGGNFCTFLIGVSWEALNALGNLYAPGWSFEITTPATRVGNCIYVTGSITVTGMVGDQLVTVRRDATGAVEVDDKGNLKGGGFGTAANNASIACMKKCWRMFGLGNSYELPEIHMRIEKWRDGSGGNKVPVYSRYDAQKATSPWLGDNWKKMPDYVRKVLQGEVAHTEREEPQHVATQDPRAVLDDLVALNGLVPPEMASKVVAFLQGNAIMARFQQGAYNDQLAKVARVLDLIVSKYMMNDAADARLAFWKFALTEGDDIETPKQLRAAVQKWRSSTGNQ